MQETMQQLMTPTKSRTGLPTSFPKWRPASPEKQEPSGSFRAIFARSINGSNIFVLDSCCFDVFLDHYQITCRVQAADIATGYRQQTLQGMLSWAQVCYQLIG